MKPYCKITAIALLITVSLTTYAGNPVWMPKPVSSQKIKSVVLLPPTARDADPCREYKRREIAGFVILPVGLSLGIGGGIMVYRGATDIINRNSNLNLTDQQITIPHRDIVFVAAGSAMSLVGLILTPTGLIMGTRGAVRCHKYCSSGHVYFAPANNGLGVACNF